MPQTATSRTSTRRALRRNSSQDPIQLLRADHRAVQNLFDQYDKARDALNDQDLIDEAAVEHATAKDLIAQIEQAQPGDDLYDAKVTVLGEHIKHHVKEEQTHIFSKLRKTKLDLKALGQQLAERKEALLGETEEA